MGRRKSNGNATASVASPGPQKSRAHAHLTSAARFGTKLYSSIFVQTWALLSKVVQIMAELLPGLPKSDGVTSDYGRGGVQYRSRQN